MNSTLNSSSVGFMRPLIWGGEGGGGGGGGRKLKRVPRDPTTVTLEVMGTMGLGFKGDIWYHVLEIYWDSKKCDGNYYLGF